MVRFGQGVGLVAEKDGRRIAVQAKGYQGSVGNDAVQQVCAGARHYGCDGGPVITNGRFTASGRDLARTTGCVLIDEDAIPLDLPATLAAPTVATR